MFKLILIKQIPFPKRNPFPKQQPFPKQRASEPSISKTIDVSKTKGVSKTEGSDRSRPFPKLPTFPQRKEFPKLRDVSKTSSVKRLQSSLISIPILLLQLRYSQNNFDEFSNGRSGRIFSKYVMLGRLSLIGFYFVSSVPSLNSFVILTFSLLTHVPFYTSSYVSGNNFKIIIGSYLQLQYGYFFCHLPGVVTSIYRNSCLPTSFSN